MKSDVIHNSSFELHNNKTYRSEERSLAQQLCGWGNGTAILEDPTNSHTRRAAIALFHLKLRQCIKLLSESGHSIVAMAIAGFTDDRSSLWREMAQSNCGQLSDPYIRAIFAFLTESDGNYDTILKEHGLGVADRVGFACAFLPDAKLISYIQELTTELTNTESGRSPSHRDLFNSWKLWECRAEFDIVKNINNAALIPPPEVSCNFCGKNISPARLGEPTKTALIFQRFTTTNTKIKLSCCPSCRKPLPRCAICLTHMGTVLVSGAERNKVKEVPKVEIVVTSAEALSWYTWCQTCRHGGHTVHLQQWFRNQTECPVTGCICKCITLDRVVDFPGEN